MQAILAKAVAKSSANSCRELVRFPQTKTPPPHTNTKSVSPSPPAPANCYCSMPASGVVYTSLFPLALPCLLSTPSGSQTSPAATRTSDLRARAGRALLFGFRGSIFFSCLSRTRRLRSLRSRTTGDRTEAAPSPGCSLMIGLDIQHKMRTLRRPACGNSAKLLRHSRKLVQLRSRAGTRLNTCRIHERFINCYLSGSIESTFMFFTRLSSLASPSNNSVANRPTSSRASSRCNLNLASLCVRATRLSSL